MHQFGNGFRLLASCSFFPVILVRRLRNLTYRISFCGGGIAYSYLKVEGSTTPHSSNFVPLFHPQLTIVGTGVAQRWALSTLPGRLPCPAIMINCETLVRNKRNRDREKRSEYLVTSYRKLVHRIISEEGQKLAARQFTHSRYGIALADRSVGEGVRVGVWATGLHETVLE